LRIDYGRLALRFRPGKNGPPAAAEVSSASTEFRPGAAVGRGLSAPRGLERSSPLGAAQMGRTGIIAIVAIVGFSVSEIPTASAACTSIQARCAVEIGGQCDPKTGRWFYGYYMNKVAGGNTQLFHACVSRELAKQRK